MNIFTASLIRFIINFKQKHPGKDKLTIDYDIVVVLLPMVLFGIQIGSILNYILPAVAITIALTIVLIYMTYTTTSKGIKLYKKEKLMDVEIKLKQDIADGEDKDLTEEQKKQILEEQEEVIIVETREEFDKERIDKAKTYENKYTALADLVQAQARKGSTVSDIDRKGSYAKYSPKHSPLN